MLKKIVFQLHWLVGITLGVTMGVLGLTGSMMSFDQEITHLFRHAPVVAARNGPMLTPEQLLVKIQETRPSSRVAMLRVSSEPTQAAAVTFMPQRGRGGGMEGGEAPNDGTQYIDPYTGAFLATPGDTAANFFLLVRRIHRGVWAGRDSTPGIVAQSIMAYSAFLLLLMIPTGLYLRWPRGIAAGQWKSWFAINFKLKGAAFLWRLHAVIGTFVFSVYVLSAHTGMMRSHMVSWYSDSVRSAAGIQRNPPPEEQRGGDSGQGGQRQRGPKQGGQRQPRASEDRGDPSQPGVNSNLGAAWSAFSEAIPSYESATLAMATAGSPLIRIAYVPKGKGVADAAVMAFDAGTGAAAADPGGTLPAIALPGAANDGKPEPPHRQESFWEALVGGAEDVHTGRYWGPAGQLIIGLSALMMPLLLVSGYMMYLGRRRRKATWTTRVQGRPADRKPGAP